MFGLGVAFVTEPWLDTPMNNIHTTYTTRGRQDVQAMNDYADYRAAKRAAINARAAYNDSTVVRNADAAAIAAAIKAYNATVNGEMSFDTPYNNAYAAADNVYDLAVNP